LPLYRYQAGSSTFPSLDLYSFETVVLLMTVVQSCNTLVTRCAAKNGHSLWTSVTKIMIQQQRCYVSTLNFDHCDFIPNNTFCFGLRHLTLGLLRKVFFGDWICASLQDKMYSLIWCATDES